MALKRKQITFPVLRLKDDSEVLVRFKEVIRDGAKNAKDDGDAGSKKKARVTTVDVLDESGIATETCSLVVGQILESILSEHYGEDYVGKSFAITRHAAREGKNYKQYTVHVLED